MVARRSGPCRCAVRAIVSISRSSASSDAADHRLVVPALPIWAGE
jgi:hypothetical protein